MNFVSILYSKSLNKYYVGEAIDLQVRIKQHNSGFYETAYTKIAKDWTLYHSIACINRIQARKIEIYMKKMQSKTYIQNLKSYPEITKRLKIKYN